MSDSQPPTRNALKLRAITDPLGWNNRSELFSSDIQHLRNVLTTNGLPELQEELDALGCHSGLCDAKTCAKVLAFIYPEKAQNAPDDSPTGGTPTGPAP
jgi:hypothetical protein